MSNGKGPILAQSLAPAVVTSTLVPIQSILASPLEKEERVADCHPGEEFRSSNGQKLLLQELPAERVSVPEGLRGRLGATAANGVCLPCLPGFPSCACFCPSEGQQENGVRGRSGRADTCFATRQ